MKNKNTRINKKKYTLIKIYLLKYQVYKNKQNNVLFTQDLDQLNIKIKQALKIIYLYHINNKKILFVGFPYIKSIRKKLTHFFIPKNVLTKQFFNPESSQKINIKTSKLPVNFFNKMDLMVFFNVTSKELVEIKKINKQNIPVILFGTQLLDENLTANSYSIFCSLSKPKLKQFCFFLIFSLLQKSKKA